jgi:alkylation response protein AidB-like acyl-CoA dehydrogenase
MSVLEVVGPRVSSEVSIDEAFGSRAADVDAGRTTVREGIADLGRRGLPDADIARSVELVSAVAREDMATAFSAWAHRMTIDYVSQSPATSAARAYLPGLATAETLGATALAAGTAHVLAGVPLPLSYRADGNALVLDGRIAWASNLIEPFLVVSAVVAADDPTQTLVVAIPSDAPGLEATPYPDLLALGATGSTSLKLSGVRVPRDHVISDDVTQFVSGVLARFLLLQGAFCSGLANRSLEEAKANLGPMGDAIRPEIDAVAADVAAADAAAAAYAVDSIAGQEIARDELLRRRLRWSELATAAVRLELSVTGGRGYLSGSATARRLREVAFLPIQAPTEVLLRWLLSHSA